MSAKSKRRAKSLGSRDVAGSAQDYERFAAEASSQQTGAKGKQVFSLF
jgi:hypothetical protein